MDSIRVIVKDPAFWKSLSGYYKEETHEVVIGQDNVSCVKSICELAQLSRCTPLLSLYIVQVMEDEPLEVLKPQLTKLILDKDQNKQRAAAELLAGVLNGQLLRTESNPSSSLQHLHRLQALVSRETKTTVEMVLSLYPQDIQTKHLI